MHPILNDAKAPLDVIYFAAKEGIENPRAYSRIMYRDHNQSLSVVKKKKTQKQGKVGKRFRFLIVPYIFVSACLKVFGNCSSALKMQVLKEYDVLT